MTQTPYARSLTANTYNMRQPRYALEDSHARLCAHARTDTTYTQTTHKQPK
jgi:hypothetical protein